MATKKKAKPAKDVSTIRYLNLQDKKLRKLPDDVAAMTALETVKLDRNPDLDVAGACAVLAKLPALRELSMTPEGGIPEGVWRLTSLETLAIEGVRVAQALPASIGALEKLKDLYIWTHEALTLPREIGRLRALERLQVRATRWNLPESFFALTAIKELSLSDCDIVRVPDAIGRMPRLESLCLTSTPKLDLGDTLQKVASLESLTYLQLSSRCVPPEVGMCRSIHELRIVREGDQPLDLPKELWKLDTLKVLDLGGNKLARLPDAVRGLQGLEELSLFECGVESLPEALGELPRLWVLNLSSNPKLTKLPKTIAAKAAKKELTVYQ
jgi:Leucine-rich repeat (LRR) protein